MPSFMDLVRDADEQSRLADLDWRRDPPAAKYSVKSIPRDPGKSVFANSRAKPQSSVFKNSYVIFDDCIDRVRVTEAKIEPPRPEGWGTW